MLVGVWLDAPWATDAAHPPGLAPPQVLVDPMRVSLSGPRPPTFCSLGCLLPGGRGMTASSFRKGTSDLQDLSVEPDQDKGVKSPRLWKKLPQASMG